MTKRLQTPRRCACGEPVLGFTAQKKICAECEIRNKKERNRLYQRRKTARAAGESANV